MAIISDKRYENKINQKKNLSQFQFRIKYESILGSWSTHISGVIPRWAGSPNVKPFETMEAGFYRPGGLPVAQPTVSKHKDELQEVGYRLTFSQQVVKLISHKVALQQHMDGSVIFTRLRQCAPKSASALYWWCPLLSRFKCINHQTCPGPAPLSSSKLFIHMWGSGPPSNTWFLRSTWVHIPNGNSISLAIFARLTVITGRPTDRPCYSVCTNRPHLASAAMQPTNNISDLL